MLNRRELLYLLGTGAVSLALCACTEEKPTTNVKDTHNNTVYDHSELAWYIQQRYGVDEADCQFYAFESSGTAYLLARGKNNSGGNHYILRVFADGVANWYRSGSWIVESMSVSDIEQTYNDASIELVEFNFGNRIIHMFVGNNKFGLIERMFVLSGTEDFYNKEGEFFIWEYDRNGRAKGLYHGAGLFANAFYGTDNRGEFIKNYGDYDQFTYNSEGRLERVFFMSAKLSNNVITVIEGSGGAGVGSYEFFYDIDGNRSTVTQNMSGVLEKVDFSHDSYGRIVQVTISESNLINSGDDSYWAKVTLTYREDGSTEYSEPITQ